MVFKGIVSGCGCVDGTGGIMERSKAYSDWTPERALSCRCCSGWVHSGATNSPVRVHFDCYGAASQTLSIRHTHKTKLCLMRAHKCTSVSSRSFLWPTEGAYLAGLPICYLWHLWQEREQTDHLWVQPLRREPLHFLQEELCCVHRLSGRRCLAPSGADGRRTVHHHKYSCQ